MVEDVTRDGKYVTPCVDSLTIVGAKKSRPVPKGTLTMVCSGVVGVPSITAVDCCIHDGFLAITDIKDDCDQEYLYEVFSSLGGQLDASATHGGVFTNLTTSILKEFRLRLPPLPEQRRIAAVLDAWDTAIATAERLVGAKRSAFEGLVHRLIDQSEVTRSELCDFATLINAKIAVEDAPFDFSIELDNIESGTGRLRGMTDASELLGQRAHFKADDVLFGKLRPYLKKFWFSNEDGMSSTEAWVLRADTKQCLPRYLYFLVRSHAFLGEANRPTGSRMPRADWDWVQSTPLPLPGTNEQGRIVDVLTLAEERWAVSGDHVTALLHQKRGLMQQLLTGKLRVPESIDRLMPDGGRVDG
jgi:type I restriction enzyme, S subunit